MTKPERVCLICLTPGADDDHYHPACVERVFGTSRIPRLDVEGSALPSLIEKLAGKISISGVQDKLPLTLSADRTSLLIVESDSRYLLKPQEHPKRHFPENEHLTMCLAGLCGIEVPPVALLRLSDGGLVYVVKRFDRTDEEPPGKIPQFDFCQLKESAPIAKYDGTAEECSDLVEKYAAADLPRLFRQFVFAYWAGDGDLHLKNLSLSEGAAGRYRLSPAYDLLNTLVYNDKRMALPVLGLDQRIKRDHWLQFAERCRLSRAGAESIVDEILARTDDAIAMVGRSPLPAQLQTPYMRTLRTRGRDLERSAL